MKLTDAQIGEIRSYLFRIPPGTMLTAEQVAIRDLLGHIDYLKTPKAVLFVREGRGRVRGAARALRGRR